MEDRVVDSRSSREGGSIRRRLECLQCGRRYTTYESIEERQLQVVKRDGTVENYDRRKLLRSVRLASVKRPITPTEIDSIATEIEEQMTRQGKDEIETRLLGEMIMERLKILDYVAYVRFASVYRNFQDIDEFYEELRDLSARRARAALNEGQAELPL
jgi:transcriptional repressor NrdR